MKPTGNRSVATWLWRPACCLLQCCIRESKRDFSELLAPASVCRVTECATQACRNIKPYGKRGDFFLLYICFNTICLSSSPVFSLASISSQSTPTQWQNQYFQKTDASRGFSSSARKTLRASTLTQEKTHTHMVSDTLFFIFATTNKTHTHDSLDKHTSFTILSVCEREAGGSWRARLQRAQYS